MKTVAAYVVLVMTVLSLFVHSLLTDPTVSTMLSPSVKTGLALVAVVLASLLPAVQSALGKVGAGLLLVLFVAGPIEACSVFSSPQGPQVVAIALKDAECIIAHDSDQVAAIIQECNLVGDVGTEVQQLLAATHAAEAKHAAGVSADAGPGK